MSDMITAMWLEPDGTSGDAAEPPAAGNDAADATAAAAPPVVVPPTLVPEALPAPTTGFAELYRDLFDPSVRLARMLCGSWDEARDITQDAFCGLHRNWRNVERPEAYLRRSIVNGASSLHRRRGRDRRRTVTPPEPAALGALELTDVIAALPARQRSAIVLRFHFDLPDAEIASALGVRTGTVASLVHRGLATLRTQLGDPPTDHLPASGAHHG